MKNLALLEQLDQTQTLTKSELLYLLNHISLAEERKLLELADQKRRHYYQNSVFLRGLIEFTNYCRNDCAYCGIRKSNHQARRYRLTKEQIMECCRIGYELGFHTFVLQGGEDPYFNSERMVDIIRTIKTQYPDCALTLSIGEQSYSTYLSYYQAGADRYLLRHETNSRTLYRQLHPDMDYDQRIRCLNDLKQIGFQVGAGFMVGLPNQTNADLVDDLLFLKEFQPHMVGIGPFIPHQHTPLRQESAGSAKQTIRLLALVRLLLPRVLLPATTALGTISPQGREKGLQAGANVIMPNLSPTNVRDKYLLYNDKLSSGQEAAESKQLIEAEISRTGYRVDMGRGDYKVD